ncbi:N-alpha-acetyltransferase 50 [Dinochytrium kinnereticum]|nr:N-alpha-acetyltransferase 50 [Dinochytrium kinnereticum]
MTLNDPIDTTRTSASSKYFRKDIGDLTPNNLGQLRVLQKALFPSSVYLDKFFADALESGEISKFAIFNDMPVGAVICRRETEDGGAPASGGGGKASKKEAAKKAKICIVSLGTLKPYRKLGLASSLLDHVITTAKSDKRITSIYLHVRADDKEGQRFYEKRGFAVKETVKAFFAEEEKKESRDAVLLAMELEGEA